MPKKIRHILENEKLRQFTLDNGRNIEKEITLLRALETKLLAGFREGLAWKPGTEYVVIGYCERVDGSDITVRPKTKIFEIQVLKMALPLGSEHAYASELLKRYVESTKAREQIDESKSRHLASYRKLAAEQ
jgi:hypothetical protein